MSSSLEQLKANNSHTLGIAELLEFQGRLQKMSFVGLKDIPNFIFRDSHQRSVYAFRTRTDGINGRTVGKFFYVSSSYRYSVRVWSIYYVLIEEFNPN